MLKVMIKRFVMTAVLAGLAGIASGKEPVIFEKDISLGSRVTYTKPKDADTGAFSGGAQIRFSLSENIKIEGSFDYRRNDFGRYVRVHVYPVQASIMAYFAPDKRVSPYLMCGVGFYYSRIEGPFNYSQTTNRFGVHAGGGLEFMLNETLSVDLGYRHILTEKFSAQEGSSGSKEYVDSGHMFILGLNFYF